MSQAEDLLNSLSENDVSTKTEPHIIVGSNRVITVPSELKRIAVQYDHNIETVTFDCPRYWDDYDMSTMNVYINYTRSDKYTGCYLADNVRVDEADNSIMHFDWTISRNVTESAGPLTILVCIKMVDADGNEINHWNSERNTDMKISKGMECGDIIVNKYPDVITYLLADMGNLADLTTEDKSSLVAAINEVRQTGGGGSSVQPDWNQNDSTQPDYIKNRPFYTGDPVETVLVEESTVSFSFSEGAGVYMGELKSTFSATVGETYKVSWDGTAYECACVNFSGSTAIGNLSIAGAGSDTGEPFIMVVVNGRGIAIGTADTSASHTFSICVFAPEVVKIDPKYIRDMYYTGDPVETVLLEETTAEFTEKNGVYSYKLGNPLSLEVGQTYQVSWDGTVYECVGTDLRGNTILGNLSIRNAGEDTGEPFLYGFGSFDTKDTSASHTISISELVSEVVKIDAKYLPDTIATKSEVEAAQSTADAAQSTAYDALNTASAAKTAAENAQSTANTAKTAAENAQSTANTAKTAAENAQTTADAAQSTANAAQSKAESIKPNWNEKNSSNPRYIANRPFYHDIITADPPYGKRRTPSAELLIDGTELYWSGSVSNLTGLLQIDKNKIYMLAGTLEKFTPVHFRTHGNTYSYGYALGNPHLIKVQYASAEDAHGGELPDTGGDWVYFGVPNSASVVTISKTKGWHGTFVEFLSEDLKLLDEKFIPASIQRTGGEVFLHSSTPNSTKKFKITVDDNGVPTITDESDSTNTWKPTNLPTVTSSDSGKFLRVSDTGEWVAETILSASGVSF